jgi:prephenate dehydrogenase
MTSSDGFDRIVIAGVGLIGGSVGLALKRAGFRGKITGLGRRWSSLKNAIDARAVDSATLDYEEAMTGADLLMLCTPVDVIPEIARKAVRHARSSCIVTDVGSTKRLLVSEIEKLMPESVHFVGAHPMAGSHETGVTAADASLFEGSICIITPIKSTDPGALAAVSELWKMIGARVETMSPQEHDFLIAAASHLPHVTACALIQTVAGIADQDHRAIDFSATGFADATRIAAGDPKIWTGILLQNADMVLSMLDRLEKELTDLKATLDSKDKEKLIEKLERAKHIRDSIKR